MYKPENNMDRLQFFMWIFCVVISVGSATDIRLRHRYYNAWTEHRNLQNEMLNLKEDVNSQFIELAKRTCTELNKNETERLKTGYAPCCRDWMKTLREDIETLMVEEYPAPCSELLSRILDEIDGKMTEVDTEVGVIINRIDKCMGSPQNNCLSSDEIVDLHTKVLRLRNVWSQYKKYKLLQTWRRMIDCFAGLSAALTKKLSELSEYACGCESKTHGQMIRALGLVPLSIHRLIGSSMDWFRVEELPDLPPTDDSKYEEEPQIMQNLDSLRMNIQQYVENNIVLGIETVLRESIRDIPILLSFLTNPDSLPAKYRLCYVKKLQKAEYMMQNYYIDYLQQVCFYGLVGAKNAFSNIVECDLRVLKKRLSKTRNCWANEKMCQEIASSLKKFDRSLNSWKQFNLTPAMEGARDCYGNASQLIFRSTNSSLDRLRRCEDVPYPDIYFSLIKNVQPYPPYENAELCSSESEDMDY